MVSLASMQPAVAVPNLIASRRKDTHRSHVKPASRPKCCHQARPDAAVAIVGGTPGSLRVNRPSFRVFFSTLLTPRPRLVFLSITVLVHTIASFAAPAW
jgi:hypothetical protein